MKDKFQLGSRKEGALSGDLIWRSLIQARHEHEIHTDLFESAPRTTDAFISLYRLPERDYFPIRILSFTDK